MKARNLFIGLAASLFITAGLISCGGAKEDSATKESATAPKEEPKAPPANDPYAVGTHVAAKWSGGDYWGATINGNANGKYQVKYDDGTTSEVSASDIKSITPKSEIKVGDKVLAVWMTNGKMYNGVVEELKDDGAMVKWDDGSAASLVSYSNITK